MISQLAISLDIYLDNGTYTAKQSDAGSRYLLISITDNGTATEIESNAVVNLKARKPSGAVSYDHGTVTDGKALILLTSDTLAEAGMVYCELEITQIDPVALLKTLTFKLDVKSEVYSQTIPESTSTFTALTEALAAAGSIGKVSDLKTEDKSTLVAGVNEIHDEVVDLQNDKEDKSNKVTSIDSESTDTEYPSAKLTYDQLALKEPNLPVTPLTPAEKFLNGNKEWATPAHNKITDLNTDADYQHITTTQVTKLTNIEENAEVNIIETVSIDGADITPDANRNIDIPLATQTNDGVLSLEDKIHIDSIEGNAEVNIVETISIDNVNVAPTDRNINLVLATAENDGMMSSEYAGKLDDIAENAEVNILEGIQIDGVDVGITLKKSDIPLATSTNDGAMSSEYAGKLDGIAENANNYTHPASHSPSIITQDANNRFVTDIEKSTWNGKQDALGFTPVPNTRKVNDKALSSDITLTQDDVGDGTTNKVFTSTEKSKLSGIAENANNYTHPASHSPSIITQDANNRFVTDIEKSTWNGKQDALGFTPVPNTRKVNDKALSSDITLTQDDVGDGTTNKVFTSTEKSKLSGIAENANNYTHPASHSPSIITQDANNRFVTDIEKSTWNGKQDALGFTPVPNTRKVNDKALSSDITLTQDDVGDGTTNKVFTSTEKSKLSGIAENANNYTHPASHSPSIITQDANNRFVTDIEKSTWNGKQDALGFTPVPNTRKVNDKALSSDITLTQDDVGDGTTNKVFTSTEKSKLSGIAENANNYTHPASHSPSIITQDANNRFVTDIEKSTWNGKQDALGFTPVPNTRKVNDKALSSDITLTQDDVGDGTTNKVFTSTEKSKLSGIAENANLYVHPNHSGDVTSVADGATTIANDAVTNAKLANMPTMTIKGNDTGSTANAKDLTVAETKALLDIDDLEAQVNSVPVSSSSTALTKALSNTIAGVMQNLIIKGKTETVESVTLSVDKGEVSVLGKNLFDKKSLTIYGNLTAKGDMSTLTLLGTISGNEVITKTFGQYVYPVIIVPTNVQSVSRISGTGISTCSINTIWSLHSLDAEFNNLETIEVYSNTLNKQISANTNMRYIALTFESTAGNANITITLTNIQLELSSTATAYEPYNATRARYPKLQSVPAITDTFNVLTGLHTQNITTEAVASGVTISPNHYPLAKVSSSFRNSLTEGGEQIGIIKPNIWTSVAPMYGSETYIYSLAVFNNKLYGGTYPNGKLLEWNGTNAWVEVAPKLGAETDIRSLAVFNNKLYGGSVPNGKLLEWNGTNAWVEVAPKYGSETSSVSLAVFNNKLYCGSAPGGKLLEWNGTNAWVEVAPMYGSETYIYSLAVFNNKLYGGTYPNGKLLEWNGTNAWVEVAPKLGAETDIRSLAVFNNKLYGGTAPNGKLLEWNDTNAWTEVAPMYGSETYIYSLAVFNNKLYGSTRPGGKLLEWNGTNAWVEVAPTSGSEERIYSLAVSNKLYGGTYPNGKLLEYNQDTSSGAGTLYYQLNTPTLSYYPPKSIPLEINSSIIHQSIMSDIAFYATEITISDSDYPIETLQEVMKVNVDTGAETPIDIATCTVESGGLSFTSTALTDGDLVWFRYEHTLDSATPTTDYTYTTSLAGGLTTIQNDVKTTNNYLQKQIDELRAIIASMAV